MCISRPLVFAWNLLQTKENGIALLYSFFSSVAGSLFQQARNFFCVLRQASRRVLYLSKHAEKALNSTGHFSLITVKLYPQLLIKLPTYP